MKKSPEVYLNHILGAIDKINRRLSGVDRGKFINDYLVHDVVIRELEVVGEATRNLPEEFMERWPEISWRKIVDFRNVMIHEYFDIDLGLVWNSVNKDLPKLREDILNILRNI